MNRSSVSTPVDLQLSASGSFNGTVTLSCSGLPAGASCAFQPSGGISPVAGSPADVTLTISTGASTPTGTFQAAINASVAGGSTRTQNLALTVSTAGGGSGTPDFSLAISNPSLTVDPSEPAVFNGTLMASGGYSSQVTISCGNPRPPVCLPSPSVLVPTAEGAPFTVTASSDVQNHFNFSIVGAGADAAHLTRSAPVELIVQFNFALNNNSDPKTVQAGETASYNLDVIPLGNGSKFPSDVNLSCSGVGLPAMSTCSFTPAQIAAGSGDTNVLLSVVTTASTATGRLHGGPQFWLPPGLSAAGVVLALGGGRKRVSRRKRAIPLLWLIALLCCLPACGGGAGSMAESPGGVGQPGTPSGNYSITVNATVGSITRSVQAVLTVK